MEEAVFFNILPVMPSIPAAELFWSLQVIDWISSLEHWRIVRCEVTSYWSWHIGTISTVEALRKEATEHVGNISRRDVGSNDGIRNARIGFAVSPKCLVGDSLSRRLEKKFVWGIWADYKVNYIRCLYLLYNSDDLNFFSISWTCSMLYFSYKGGEDLH